MIRDFRAEGEAEAAILDRIERFVAEHGEAVLGSEIAGETGHVTASAWIVNVQKATVLLVFERKSGEWKLPGAHCDGELIQTAKTEAVRALGTVPATQNPRLWALTEREIAPYWNTPAHCHFELIFRFEESENGVLPRGAKWFPIAEAGQLNDEILLRLTEKLTESSQ